MVFRGADHEHRRADAAQRNRFVVEPVTSLGQVVAQIQAAQTLAVHHGGQACHVGVPDHQVVAVRRLAQQQRARALRPDQLARVQKLERSGHLPPAQKTLLGHQVFEHADLRGVNQHAHFPRFGKLGLRRQQRHAGQCRAEVGRPGLPRLQVGCCDCHQRAPQAVARQVHRLRSGRADVLQRRQHALAHVVVELEQGIICVRVAPGHDVNRVPLFDQPAHHGIVRREVQNVVLHDA